MSYLGLKNNPDGSFPTMYIESNHSIFKSQYPFSPRAKLQIPKMKIPKEEGGVFQVFRC